MAIELMERMGGWNFRATFLPLPNFREAARSLDRNALITSMRTLDELEYIEKAYQSGWEGLDSYTRSSRLPHTSNWWAMWREYPAARAAYGYEIANVLSVSDSSLRWADSVIKYKEEVYKQLGGDFKYTAAIARQWARQIEWLGEPKFHATHRKYLMYFKPVWYRQYGWDDPATKRNVQFHLDDENSAERVRYQFWFPDKSASFAAGAVAEAAVAPGGPY